MGNPAHPARPPRRLLLAWGAGLFALASELAFAGVAGPRAAEIKKDQEAERNVSEWLVRIHDASRLQSYTGTFVVWSHGGSLSSARIWHACNGRQQVERLESLTGTPGMTIRRDEEVLTFMPDAHVVRSERREPLGSFPDLVKGGQGAIADLYTSRKLGSDRVAGFDADVVQLSPVDDLRFGYRIWSEKQTGLVLKLQTLDGRARVLEQVAFSDLRLERGLQPDKLAQAVAVPPGWRMEKAEAFKTSPDAQGWTLKSEVHGFRPMSCYKRPVEGVLQWVFSDGLASVSLFIEPYQRQHHGAEGSFVSGATHTLTLRLGDWWITAVGEVPTHTLRAFARNLERQK